MLNHRLLKLYSLKHLPLLCTQHYYCQTIPTGKLSKALRQKCYGKGLSHKQKPTKCVLEMLCNTEILCVHFLFFSPSFSGRCAKSSQIKTVSSSNIFFKGSRFRYRWDSIQISIIYLHTAWWQTELDRTQTIYMSLETQTNNKRESDEKKWCWNLANYSTSTVANSPTVFQHFDTHSVTP